MEAAVAQVVLVHQVQVEQPMVMTIISLSSASVTSKEESLQN